MAEEREVTEARFREIMSRFATGVTLVTGSAPGGSLVGLTANAVASISLEPRLVMVSLDRNSSSLPALVDTGWFAVSVLCAEDRSLAERFAQGPPHERFEGLRLRVTASGLPVLEGALAWMECRVWRTVEAGDHVILLGEVTEGEAAASGEPLVFFRGRYGRVSW